MNEEGGLEALAGEMGIGTRHLRRVLRQELGVSPVELAQTHRLLLAKQLLTETALPIINVAFASGFASVRRFNALFIERYRLTPLDVRKAKGKRTLDETIRLNLSYRPPFAWDAMLRFLAGRAVTGVEAVVDRSYLRTLAMGGVRGWIKVEPAVGRHAITVELPTSLVGVLPHLLAKLRNLFDLDARPDIISDHLGKDAHLGAAILANPGLRVPGAFQGFELATRAILGQQVSVKAATTLMARLAETFGEPIETPFPALTRLSPTPERVAAARIDELTGFGLVKARAECVRALATAVRDKIVSLDAGPDPAASMDRLTAIPGIGPWTAHYVAMRGPAMARRLPPLRPRLAEGVGRPAPSGDARTGRSVAPVAVLCGDAPVE